MRTFITMVLIYFVTVLAALGGAYIVDNLYKMLPKTAEIQKVEKDAEEKESEAATEESDETNKSKYKPNRSRYLYPIKVRVEAVA